MANINSHSIYVVYFCDGRIKFGSTANVKKRMRYYRQEARRNGHDWLVWYAPKAFESKASALHAERAMRIYFRSYSKHYQREWLFNNIDFKAVIHAANELRCLLGNENDADKQALHWFGSFGDFKGLTA